MAEMVNNNLEIKETMTSLELLEQINYFRNEIDGKRELKHYDLLKVIRDEFEDEIGVGEISLSSQSVEMPNGGKRSQPLYILTLSQAKQVLVRESKLVRKAVIKYIEKLEKKVMQQMKPMSPMEMLELQFQMAKEINNRVEKVEDDLSNMRDSMLISDKEWRKETNNLINRMNLSSNGAPDNISILRTQIYQTLELRANCNLSTRLNHKKNRMIEQGVPISKISIVNNLDVIADDEKLKQIYISIIKEFAIKYGIKG